MSTNTHWELGIDQGEEGTMTIGAYVELSSALYALVNCEDSTAFIDQWSKNRTIGQSITKQTLKELLK